MRYECNGCGKCCRSVGHLPLPSVEGVCSLLDLNTNRCTIYPTRPLICRVDMYHEMIETGMSLEEWYKVNQDACGVLSSRQ